MVVLNALQMFSLVLVVSQIPKEQPEYHVYRPLFEEMVFPRYFIWNGNEKSKHSTSRWSHKPHGLSKSLKILAQ